MIGIQIIKCNKCDFVSHSAKEFSTIFLYLPEKRKTFGSIGKRWDELTKQYERAELVFAGLDEFSEQEEPHIIIHLCPRHTEWFAQQFSPQNLQPDFLQKKKQKKLAKRRKKPLKKEH